MDASIPIPGFMNPVTGKPKGDPEREYLAGYAWRSFSSQVYNTLANHAESASRLYGDRLYDAMLLDGTVRATINTLKAAVLADGVQVEPALQDGPGADELDPAEVELASEIAEFCERALTGIDECLEDVLWQLLDGIPYGCMLGEVTYKHVEKGPDAGRLTLQSIHVKPRWSWYFLIDRAGGVAGITGAINRQPNDPPQQVLPRDKFIVFSWLPKARDPRGTPALDAVYDAWNMKVQTRPEYWKYLSRFASPSYFGTTAEGATDVEERDPETGKPTGKTLTAQQAFLQAILALENASAAVGAHGATLTTLDPMGEGSAFITAFDEFRHEIVFGILQQVRATLEATHSSKSDSETAQDILGILVRVAKKLLAGVLVRDVIKPLVSHNWGPDVAERLHPRVVLGMVDQQDFSRNANAVARLASVGMIAAPEREGVMKWLGLGGLIRKAGDNPAPLVPLAPPGQPQQAPGKDKAVPA